MSDLEKMAETLLGDIADAAVHADVRRVLAGEDSFALPAELTDESRDGGAGDSKTSRALRRSAFLGAQRFRHCPVLHLPHTPRAVFPGAVYHRP